jgi:hypothetical protein
LHDQRARCARDVRIVENESRNARGAQLFESGQQGTQRSARLVTVQPCVAPFDEFVRNRALASARQSHDEHDFAAGGLDRRV